MLRRLILLLALLLTPALAQARVNAIQPELVAEGPAIPGGQVELAILMHTRPGWHGYWLNPGDAGLPMDVQWQLPKGFSVGPLRYPVPTRLKVAGLMNYVYERDYAVLARLKAPPGIGGLVPIRATARWLACTETICVPEQGEFALNLPAGGLATMDARFNEWRRALPRPLATLGRFSVEGDKLRVAIPLPANVDAREPYIFPITNKAVDYEAPQSFRRAGDWVVAELPLKAVPKQFSGVVAFADSRGLEFTAVPGIVPEGGTPLSALGWKVVLLAVLGAIAGGILLNLMPCVFPILALKALHLSRAGGDPREVRADALAYTAGTIVGTGALGAVLLAIRAAGAEAGWAFQLQDPRTIMLLLLLAVAITANLLGLFELPVLGGRAQPAGSFGTGALAAFVATPCAGPFLGAALGTALLLPAAGSVAVFAALGLGLALPFVLVAFVPALRTRLPRPGRWMDRLKRFLAIPMAASAFAALWLLDRLAGERALLIGAALSVGHRSGPERRPVVRRLRSRPPAAPGQAGSLGQRARRSRARRRRCRGGSPADDVIAFGRRLGAVERSAGREPRAAGQAGVRLFHRRLVPDLQGQRSRRDRPERSPRCVRQGGGQGAGRRLDQRRPGDHPLPREPRAGRCAALFVVPAGRGTGRVAAGADPGDAH